ncbi:MAG: multidrug effflux MFS transporter [Fulvivirga sp.]
MKASDTAMVIDKKNNRFLLILILGSLTTIGPLSIDMYLPAFEEISIGLNTDINHISLSLSSFFIGLAVGQLFYGPMLERFGRKKPVYVGLGLYVLASIGCAFSTSVEGLIAFRFFQALGSCAGMVSSRAIVRDLFTTKEMAKVFSMLMMVIAVSPIIAPTAGGYVTASLGWRAVFGVLIVLSVMVLVSCIFWLPESKKADPSYSLKPRKILRNYIDIFKDKQFLVFAFTGAIAYAGLYAYLSGSPYLFMQLFNVSEKEYGLIFAIIAAGLISASQINNLLLRKLRSERIILFSLMAQSVIGIGLLVVTYLNLSGLYLTTSLIFGYLFFLGFIFPNSSALSLATLGHTAGNASALMGSLQMVVGALASALVSILQSDSAMPMAAVMALCSTAALFLLSFGSRRLVLG